MKLSELRIENFRSFEDETISYDDYTCFVGPNGSGKSAILMALNVFFRESKSTQTDVLVLSEEDFHHRNVNKPVKITLTFEELAEEAQKDFQHYYRQGKLILYAIARWDEKERNAPVKQCGSRLVMKEFAAFFEASEQKERVEKLREIYKDIRGRVEALPEVSTKAAMTEALRNYEESHPEQCELLDDSSELYGWTRGQNRLEKYIQWVYVPAIKDPSVEQEESSKSALGRLLERTVRTKLDFSDEIETVKADVTEKYRQILDKRNDDLKGLALSMEKRMQEYAGGHARLELQWRYDEKKSITINDPSAWAQIGNGLFIGQVARSGHGLQRAFLVTLMHELAGSETQGGPKLLLGFEEPELYQHPPQARRLSDVLEKLSSAGGNSQIIVTTHSPYFVSSKGFENVRMVRKVSGGKTHIRATTHEKLEGRISRALAEEPKSPTSHMARLLQILQPSQNELFFTSVAVLVEGQEDIAYISTHLDLSNQLGEFRALGCHFVVAEGKTNMSRLVAIAQELGIPIFAVVDGDSDAKPQDIENNRRDNKCLLKLFSLSGEKSLPDKTLWNENFVMWTKRIGDTVKEEIGDAWEDAENKVREDKGFRDGVKRKNPMLITATLEELWNQGKQSASLIKLCGAILHYAQKVEM